jgi:hypothetical protein
MGWDSLPAGKESWNLPIEQISGVTSVAYLTFGERRRLTGVPGLVWENTPYEIPVCKCPGGWIIADSRVPALPAQARTNAPHELGFTYSCTNTLAANNKGICPGCFLLTPKAHDPDYSTNGENHHVRDQAASIMDLVYPFRPRTERVGAFSPRRLRIREKTPANRSASTYSRRQPY